MYTYHNFNDRSTTLQTDKLIDRHTRGKQKYSLTYQQIIVVVSISWMWSSFMARAEQKKVCDKYFEKKQDH